MHLRAVMPPEIQDALGADELLRRRRRVVVDTADAEMPLDPAAHPGAARRPSAPVYELRERRDQLVNQRGQVPIGSVVGCGPVLRHLRGRLDLWLPAGRSVRIVSLKLARSPSRYSYRDVGIAEESPGARPRDSPSRCNSSQPVVFGSPELSTGHGSVSTSPDAPAARAKALSSVAKGASERCANSRYSAA